MSSCLPMSDYLSRVDWSAVLYAYPSAVGGWNAFMSLLWQTLNLYVPPSVSVSAGKQSHTLLRSRKTGKYEAKRRQVWNQLTWSPHDSSITASQMELYVCIWRKLETLCVKMKSSLEKRIIEVNNLGAFNRYINNRIRICTCRYRYRQIVSGNWYRDI